MHFNYVGLSFTGLCLYNSNKEHIWKSIQLQSKLWHGNNQDWNDWRITIYFFMRVLTWKIFLFFIFQNVLWEKEPSFLVEFFFFFGFTRTRENVTFILFLWEGKPSFNVEEFFLLYKNRRRTMLPLFFSYGKENRILPWKNIFFPYQKRQRTMLALFFSYKKENRVLTWKNRRMLTLYFSSLFS